MTDNRTTELKAIMDEFEHECFMLRVEASETRARDDVVRKSYERIRDEFAGRIAAVLVSDRESELQSALNKAAGNWAKADALLREQTSGTLTAKQVERAIRDCSTYASYDGCTYYASGIRLQAIADELNATLRSDTSAVRLAERLRSIADEMRNVGASSMTPHELLAFYAREVDKVADSLKFAATLGNGTCRNEWAKFGKFRCSECWTQVDAISTNTTQPMPIRYCPNCGAKAVG